MDRIEERDPIEEYWAAHGPNSWTRPYSHQPGFDWYEATQPVEADPWSNGRNSFAAIVLGLIAMLMVSFPL